MKTLVIYIHGKGGCAAESARYAPLFPESEVIGYDYQAETPWQAAEEFPAFFDAAASGFEAVTLVANSIGAYFALCSLGEKPINRAFFISPIVDMEQLICCMMAQAGVKEDDLRRQKRIETGFGEALDWAYLCWVRSHPIRWHIPTDILYGSRDPLQSLQTVNRFAAQHSAAVTVMQNGEHWFHTEEQLRFLDDWITDRQTGRAPTAE